MLHWHYIHIGVRYHQVVLLVKYQAHMHQLLHDGQGHQSTEWFIVLRREHFHWNTMHKDIVNYVS